MSQPHARMPLLVLGWAILAMGAGGCAGDYGLADETYPVEPVALLEGELHSRLDTHQGPTAMTLAWASSLADAEQLASLLLAEGPSCGLERGALLQPMSFRPHFPSSFVLPLSTAPALAAQHSLEPIGGQGRMALGWVISFQDSNQNGVLDLGTDGARPERGGATSLDSGLAVLFLDGVLPRERAGTWQAWPLELPRGFSLLGVHRPEGGPSSLVALPADSTLLSLDVTRHACP